MNKLERLFYFVARPLKPIYFAAQGTINWAVDKFSVYPVMPEGSLLDYIEATAEFTRERFDEEVFRGKFGQYSDFRKKLTGGQND